MLQVAGRLRAQARLEQLHGGLHQPSVLVCAVKRRDQPLLLDSGHRIDFLQIAYQTYGTLDRDKKNAILICHALSGDQHVANDNPVTGKPGWWSDMVGPGKPIDTDRYFVICSNVVGGCMGTTGPASTNPATDRAYGIDLPVITVRDMVRAQTMLLDRLGIDSLFSIAGGSLGGMQVLEWAASYPSRVFSALPIATGARHSSQNIAFHEVGRQAIMADPYWRFGRYLDQAAEVRLGDGQGRHQDHDVAERADDRSAGTGLHRHAVAHPELDGVAAKLDSRHEAAAADLGHGRVGRERLEQLGEELDLRLEAVEGALFLEDVQ